MFLRSHQWKELNFSILWWLPSKWYPVNCWKRIPQTEALEWSSPLANILGRKQYPSHLRYRTPTSQLLSTHQYTPWSILLLVWASGAGRRRLTDETHLLKQRNRWNREVIDDQFGRVSPRILSTCWQSRSSSLWILFPICWSKHLNWSCWSEESSCPLRAYRYCACVPPEWLH